MCDHSTPADPAPHCGDTAPPATADSAAVFILNPQATYLDLANAVDRRLAQARGILTLLVAEDNLQYTNWQVTADIVWAASTLVDEITALYHRQHDLWREEHQEGNGHEST